jgi:hypothetical protein
MSNTRSLVVTLVQLEGHDVAVNGHVTFPGLLTQENYNISLRVPGPDEDEDWRDWARQAVAALCEVL